MSQHADQPQAGQPEAPTSAQSKQKVCAMSNNVNFGHLSRYFHLDAVVRIHGILNR